MRLAPRTQKASALVIFGIPLISRAVARDWSRVVHQFNATLGSLYGQAADDFRIVVIGTDEPEIRIPVDERFAFLPYPDVPDNDPYAMRRDMEQKRRAIARHARSLGGGYLMFVDADDLVSSELASFIEAYPHPHGYLVAAGYIFDAATGAIAPYPLPGFEDMPLDMVCGTSAIVRLSAEELPATDDDASVFAHLFGKGHHWVRQQSNDAGRPLEDIPIRAVTYVRAVEDCLSFRFAKDEESYQRHVRLMHAIPRHAVGRTPRLDRTFNLKAAEMRPSEPRDRHSPD